MFAISNVLAVILVIFICMYFLVDFEEGKESFYTSSTNTSHTQKLQKRKILEPVEKPQVFKCRKS